MRYDCCSSGCDRHCVAVGLDEGVGAFEVDRTMLGACGEKEAWYPWTRGGDSLRTEGGIALLRRLRMQCRMLCYFRAWCG
jgi:hypothetical protein